MNERQQLQQAMAALEAQSATLGDAVVEAALASMRETLAKLEAQERESTLQLKYITILFTDVVGSTRMGQSLDPEDTLTVMDGALQRFNRVIERHGGRVLRFMGDGLMAAFGATGAREDDAERAVLAGLGVLEEARSYAGVAQARWGLVGFKVRVGVNTGQVVLGSGVEAENTIMGMAINLAARMESSAPPDSLLISHATYRHVRGLFDVHAQPPLLVKGKEEPLQTYVVLRAILRPAQASRRGVEGVETRLVGRDAELAALRRAFEKAIETSQTQFVTVVGEPGIGKSRLVSEFEGWVDLQPAGAFRFKGSATEQMSGTPYALLRDLFASKFQILESDSAVQARQKLEQGFAEQFSVESELRADLIGALLGFDIAGVGVKNDPEQLRQQALFYLQQYFAALTEHTPALLVFDDIHWADSPSLDAIRQLVRQCPPAPLMIVCLTRFRLFERYADWGEPGFVGDVACTRLDLTPLTASASYVLVEEILNRVEQVPVELSQLLVTRAEGNPFYMEELVNMLIDDGVILRESETGRWQVDPARLKGLHVPPTLTAVLQARLESLPGEERLTLQEASVIGRTFWDTLLQALKKVDQPPHAQLNHLVTHRTIYAQDASQFEVSLEYSFKHALFRDMVYETVLKDKRRSIHTGVAAWLVQVAQASERTEEYAALIAGHYVLGGEQIAAADWSTRAGERAIAQGAFREARQFFDQALDLLPAEELERRWRALLGRDEALGALGEVAARLADDAALLALAREMGDDDHLAEAYTHQGYYVGITGDERSAIQAYDAALAAARRAGNQDALANILSLKLVSLTHLGGIDQAAGVMDELHVVLQEVQDELILARILTNISVYLSAIGDLSRVAQLLDQTLAITRRLGNSAGETIVLSNLGYHYVIIGLPEQGKEALERALVIAQKIGYSTSIAFSQLNLGLVHIRLGNTLAARQILERAVSGPSWVDQFGLAIGYSYLGLAAEASMELAVALDHFAEAMQRLEAMGMYGNVQDARAGLGRCWLKIGDIDQALEHALGVWDYLVEHGSHSLEFPILAYQTCAEVFFAAGNSKQASDVIRQGYEDLMARAGKISDPAWRTAFLENIPEHRAMTRAWEHALSA